MTRLALSSRQARVLRRERSKLKRLRLWIVTAILGTLIVVFGPAVMSEIRGHPDTRLGPATQVTRP